MVLIDDDDAYFCDGYVYDENPRLLVTERERLLIQLWQYCYAPGGFGAGHYAVMPDGGAPMDQPAILLDAFQVILGKVKEIEKEAVKRRRS